MDGLAETEIHIFEAWELSTRSGGALFKVGEQCLEESSPYLWVNTAMKVQQQKEDAAQWYSEQSAQCCVAHHPASNTNTFFFSLSNLLFSPSGQKRNIINQLLNNNAIVWGILCKRCVFKGRDSRGITRLT